MLNTAVKAARRASAIITRGSLDLDRLIVRNKRDNDYVSEIDQKAEEAIIDTLLTAYPRHSILAEESGVTVNSSEASEYQWIIDPLDGTTNFIHGFPQYCVSIGIQHRSELTQAVVFDPVKDELFTATRGRGAFLNDRRIRVSSRTHLRDALVGTGFPFKELSRLEPYMATLRTILTSSAGVRRAGAAALDLAYVAAGRLDCFWEMGLSKWDMAGGALLIQEAGGLVGDFAGGPGFMESGDIAAGTPKVYAELLEVLRAAPAPGVPGCDRGAIAARGLS